MHHPIYPCFLANKATETYLRLVQQAKARIPAGYIERHHIIPQALGGDDSPGNLVDLTAREHFICHLLLVKMTSGQARAKMAFAANMLVQAENSVQQRYKVTSRLYELVKREFSKVRGELNTKLWQDPEFRDRMLSKWTEERREWYQEMGRARLADPKVRAEYAARTDKLWADDGYRERVTDAIRAAKGTTEQRAKSKANAEKMWADDEYRSKVSLAIKEGRKQSKLDGGFISPRDASELMKKKTRAVQLMVDAGELEAIVTVGGHRRIKKASVMQWLARHGGQLLTF